MYFNADNEGNERDLYENEETQNPKTLCTQEKLALSSWGLPEKILQHYIRKGITHMFHWQLECLMTGKVLEGGNLIYSAPTSAGKTLVAEILISQTIFERHKKVLLILPFVSVAREKMFYFQSMFSLNGIKVEGFMGGHSPSAGFKQIHMAVCTIEKANSIVNRLLEENNLNSLGLVVVDELHLLGDPYRGYLLELLLAKLKYMSSKLQINIQIVGMSATLPNLKVLADWLNADLYFSNYRPIPLFETLKCGDLIYDKKLNIIRQIVPIQSEIPDGSEQIGQLCLETITNGHSVLIFCPSKAWCENLADEIALFFKRLIYSKKACIKSTPGWILRNQLNLEKINQVIEYLKMTPVGLDVDLQKTVSYGVAFHHAGLTLDERDIIEGSFRNGSLRVLCATSTLSSGVNLPARRVIIRSPMVFGSVIDNLTYRQMIGRAGRMGVDSEGESILICKPNEKMICQHLIISNLKPIESCLGRGPLSSSLKRALLEIIASGIASTPKEVQQYANCTFLASSSKHNLENPIHSCIRFLEDNEFIRLQENGNIYMATPLGQACLASSMPPDEGLSLFRELQRARRCFVLDTDLHIIYQVTPYSVSEQWIKLDWLHVLNILENLPENMKRVGELVGVEEPFLIRIVKGTLNPNAVENRIKLSIHRRFYTALALQDLVNEIPLTEVAKKYQCNKGTLQSLQQSAATYAGMVTEFTRRLGWGSIELIFSQFQERLQFGVQRDLCELMRLPLLNVIRARALYNAGYTNMAALANASPSDLENVLYSVIPFQSKKEIAGETSFERDERNKLNIIWITGKADLSVREAAELLIEGARSALELELGVEGAKWGKNLNESRLSNESKVSVMQKVENGKEIKNNTSNSVNSYYYTENEGKKSKWNDNSDTNHKELISSSYAPAMEKNMFNNNSSVHEFPNQSFKSFSGHSQNIGHKTTYSLKNKQATGSIGSSTVHPNSIDLLNLTSKYLVKNSEKNSSFNETFKRNDNFMDTEVYQNQNYCKISTSECIEVPKKEDFSTSFNINNSLKSSKTANECNKIYNTVDKIDESDSGSNYSEYSVQVTSENPVVNEILSGDNTSGDMFEIQEKEIVSKINIKNDSHLGTDKLSKEVIADINIDLFSQSLTFDTQLQKVLDADESFGLNEKNKCNLKKSISFNSDDLGFVSDFSPPKLNHTKKECSPLYEKYSSCEESLNRTISTDFNNIPIFASSPLDVKPNENSPFMNQSQTLKRKSCINNSPDFIIGSDDSWIEDKHLIKKPKVGNPLEQNIVDASVEILHVGGSDDEIMPTPKFHKTSISTDRSDIRDKTFANRKRKFLRSKSISDKRSMNKDIVTCDDKNKITDSNIECEMSPSIIKEPMANEEKINDVKNGSINFDSSPVKINWEKINIVEIDRDEEISKYFWEELKLQKIVGFALGCQRIIRERKSSIGSKIMKKLEKPKEILLTCQYNNMALEGVAIYFKANIVFYLSFNGGSTKTAEIMNKLKEIFLEEKTVRLFDTKEQIKLLYHFTSILLEGLYQDPKTANWLLSKNWKEKSFSSIIIEYIPEATKLTSQLGLLSGYSGPGTNAKSSISAKTRACIEAFLSFHVTERQLKLLKGKSLLQLFEEVEMPLVICIAEMEIIGFQFDRNKLLEIKTKLDLVESNLCEKAYSMAQYKFSLASPVAVSKVLYKDLKLGVNDSLVTKKGRRPSTNKKALQELSIESNHPLPNIILHWRKIQSIITKVLAPLLQIQPEISRLFSNSQMYTVTGRIAMQEPNLQNMPRNFELNSANDVVTISVREIFIPSDGYTLLSVDYCQIELRLLAHLSGDENLIQSINNSRDIFAEIASQIYGIAECNVNDELRQKAKQTCYGIIYGITPRALSHQLQIEESVALTLMEDFRNRYKGVSKFIEDTIKNCKKRGFVVSLFGRRRYLSSINDSNPVVRNEAERQAINTTIQGSAADLIKIAMVKIRKKFKDMNEKNFNVNLLLHLHDELLFEVRHNFIEIVAVILKDVMENAVTLKVSTPVKFHTGSSWGRLNLFEI